MGRAVDSERSDRQVGQALIIRDEDAGYGFSEYLRGYEHGNADEAGQPHALAKQAPLLPPRSQLRAGSSSLCLIYQQ